MAFEDFSGNRGDPVPYEWEEIEIAVIRGLSVNREENMSYDQYHYWRDIEDMGIVVYTPLGISDYE